MGRDYWPSEHVQGTCKPTNTEIRTALASPVLRERFQMLDAEIAPSSPEEFRELSRRETIKWAEVVKISGAKLD